MKYPRLILIILICLQFILLLHLEFTAWPELLVWPYLMLKGWQPYRDIAIAHSPLVVYSLKYFYHLFGVGILQQKLASWLVIIGLDLTVYLVSKQLFGVKKALMILLIYIPLQAFYDGNGIWFDHVLAFFPILIFLSLRNKKFFIAGLLWGIALLVKQTAFWLSPAILISFLLVSEKGKFIKSFVSGLLLVATVFVVALLLLGLQSDFFNWAIKFGIGTLPRLQGQIRPPVGRDFVALLPFVIVIPMVFQRNKYAISMLPWLIAGSMGTIPRWGLFHFQPSLPFLAILIGLALETRRFIPTVLIALSTVMIIRGIGRDLGKPDRFATNRDLAVTDEIRRRTREDQPIFITGYWENQYALTETLPSMRPFIQELPWYLAQPSIEDSVLADLRSNRPVLVVKTIIEGEQISSYLSSNYRTVSRIGDVDIMEPK